MDMQKMMQQAQEMQTKMQKMQEDLADMEVSGSAGGGMVTITMTCKGEMRDIKIDPSLIREDEREILEDLVKAAANDARTKADQRLQEETQKAMQELGLPANMQMPF